MQASQQGLTGSSACTSANTVNLMEESKQPFSGLMTCPKYTIVNQNIRDYHDLVEKHTAKDWDSDKLMLVNPAS